MSIHYRDDAEFTLHHDGNNNKYAVLLEKGYDRIPVFTSISAKAYYQEGLQKNHRDLVNMQVVMEGVRESLNAHLKMNKLTETKFVTILESNEHFIERVHEGYNNLYTKVDNFIGGAVNGKIR